MNGIQENKQLYMRAITMVMFVMVIVFVCPINIFAEAEKNTIIGKVYEFDKDSNYEFSNFEKSAFSDKMNTYGNFSVSGDIGDISEKDGVPAYEVSLGNLNVYYTYSDTLMNAEETSWHLIEDKGKKVDGSKLDEIILKGAIILQTSKDRKNWTDVKCQTNAFGEDVSNRVMQKLLDVAA